MVPALIVVVLTGLAVLVWFEYQRKADLIERCLRRQAFRRKGKVHPATAKAFPFLTFTHRNSDVLVSAHAGEGDKAGWSTFVHVSLPRQCRLLLEIRPRSAHRKVAKERELTEMRTGHSKFDELFESRSNNTALARKIMDRRMRSAVLRLAKGKGVHILLRADMKLHDSGAQADLGPRLDVSVPGVRSEQSEYDRVIEFALMLSDRLLESARATA